MLIDLLKNPLDMLGAPRRTKLPLKCLRSANALYRVALNRFFIRRLNTVEFALAEANLATYTLNTVTSPNGASNLTFAYGPHVVESGNLACTVYPRHLPCTAVVGPPPHCHSRLC